MAKQHGKRLLAEFQQRTSMPEKRAPIRLPRAGILRTRENGLLPSLITFRRKSS